MLQTRFLKQNDQCDDCIICCNSALGCMTCLLQALGAEDELVELVLCVSDLVNCAVVSCMLAQHQVEIENIKEESISPDVQKVLPVMPAKQQEMMTIKMT